MNNEITDHPHIRIDKVKVTKPFRYFYVRDAFPVGVYENLIATIRGDGDYACVNSPHESRLSLFAQEVEGFHRVKNLFA